jgi:hypothetical protein
MMNGVLPTKMDRSTDAGRVIPIDMDRSAVLNRVSTKQEGWLSMEFYSAGWIDQQC